MLIQHLPLLSKKHIVLASASPRRAELLQGLGLKATIVPSTFAENLEISSFPCPGDYAVATAKEKALEVSLHSHNGGLADLVIGADTVVELDGRVLEKPSDAEDAFRMLSNLSGRQHKVYTGVSLVLPKVRDSVVGRQPFVRAFWEETKVEFAMLESEAIRAYIASGEPMDKAGAYGIQGIGGSFVKGVQGCYFNVMGFPVHRFSEEVNSLITAGYLNHAFDVSLWRTKRVQVLQISRSSKTPRSLLKWNVCQRNMAGGQCLRISFLTPQSPPGQSKVQVVTRSCQHLVTEDLLHRGIKILEARVEDEELLRPHPDPDVA
ncbi:hypothetical protein R1flu_025837 [Riccia fluitans]|uniref:Maf-like protein n=1 Tax=Riccia fluitans TaxID=41844 RepID=A0ABD1XYV9_9MARC